MPAETDFQNDPFSFLRSNIVIPGGFATEYTAGIKTFRLRLEPNLVGKRHGNPIPVYFLEETTQATSITAYWCPYKQDSMYSVTVGSLASYMFTPTMDGCSLGVGHDAGNGTRVISHVNSGNYGANLETALGLNKAREEQRKIQANLLKHYHGAGNVSVVSPLNYMADADGSLVLKSTTVGVRSAQKNDWEFFAQRYYKHLGDFDVILYLRDLVSVF